MSHCWYYGWSEELDHFGVNEVHTKELELLRSEMILSTLSGCTAEREKEQVLPIIRLLSLPGGSVTGGGRSSLILVILSRKIHFVSWLPLEV